MTKNDALFREENVFRKEMMVRGLSVIPGEEKTCIVRKEGPDGTNVSLVAALDFGATYLGHFQKTSAMLRGTVTKEDPRLLPPGEVAVSDAEFDDHGDEGPSSGSDPASSDSDCSSVPSPAGRG